MTTQVSARDAVLMAQQLERVVASRVFARAGRSQRFLRYLVGEALADPSQTVKEYTIAMEVFDRDPDYDPAVDATVRVEAGRLRSRLREYYADEGRTDGVILSLPKGGYRVVLSLRVDVGERASEALAGDEARAMQTAAREQPQPVVVAEQSSGVFTEQSTGGEGETDDEGEKGGWRRLRVEGLDPMFAGRVGLWAKSGVAALLLGLLGGYGVWRLGRGQHRLPIERTLAVLPLKNLSGDAGQDYFADGTTDELITELARVPELRVVSWNSVQQERDSKKSLQRIAQELGADVLVEGSVVRSGETVRINAQLIDTKTDTHLWAGSFEGRAGEVMVLEDRAAAEIVAHSRAGGARGTASTEPARLPTMIDPIAHEAYLHGRNFVDKRQAAAGAEQFRRAIELDPRYAAAYTGLAMALESEALLGIGRAVDVIPEAMAAVERSLELDPQNGDALIERGSLETSFLWQWDAAERDLTRGVALSPNNSYGRMMLSVYMDAMGKADEAVRQMQAAVEIDPLSFFMARHYGSTLFYARRYEEALRQLEYAREMHPASAGVVDPWMSAAYEKEGRLDEAVRYDLLAIKEDGPKMDGEKLLATYQRAGWRAYWVLRLEGMRQARNVDVCDGYFDGLAAVGAGRRGEAIAELKDASERHCYWMVMTRTNPLLDDLRGDPRFAEVLAPLHLPPTAR